MKTRAITLTVFLFCALNLNAQSLIWETVISTTDTLNEGVFIAHDQQNNIFTVGDTHIGALYLSKQDSNGNLQWHFLTAVPSDTKPYAYPTGLVVDDSGYVYMSGYITDGYNHDSGFVIKANYSGGVMWRYYDTVMSGTGKVLDMKKTPDGGIVLITLAPDTAGTEKAYVQKIQQTTGVVVWSQQLPNVDTAATNFAGYAWQHNGNYIGVDADGNIYATAVNYHPHPGSMVCAFAKYSSSGTLIWQAQTTTPVGAFDEIGGCNVDINGNLSAVGYTRQLGHIPASLAMRLNSNGAFTYYEHHIYAAPNDSNLMIMDVKTDSLGNAYVAGAILNHFGIQDTCVAAKIDSNGTVVWLKKYCESAAQNFYAQGYMHNNNTFYTVGQCYSASSPAELGIIVSCYDSSGTLAWSQRRGYHNIVQEWTEGWAIDVDGSGNVLVCGQATDTSQTVTNYNEAYIAKFGISPLSVINPNVGRLPILIFPQPAANTLTFELSDPAILAWDICNVSGTRMLSGITNTVQKSFDVDTRLWPAGSYIFLYRDTDSKISGAITLSVIH